jgi:hypothetical protein
MLFTPNLDKELKIKEEKLSSYKNYYQNQAKCRFINKFRYHLKNKVKM